MKRILNIAIVGLFLYGVIGCDDINSIHQEYLDEGEDVYVGIPTIESANTGYKRIQLVWKITADPKISATSIYWNDGKDSVNVPVDRTDSVMRKTIDLAEGNYIFNIKNRSAEGDLSLTKVISGTVVGDTYVATLKGRPIASQIAKPNGLEFNWGAEEGCLGANLTYINNIGIEKTLINSVADDDAMIFIDDYTVGGSFSYTSLYLPGNSAIDTVESLPIIGMFPNPSHFELTPEEWAELSINHIELDRSIWEVTASSEEFTGEGAGINGKVGALIDGEYSTFWCSAWTNNKPTAPPTVDIDLTAVQIVSSIEMARRDHGTWGLDTKAVEMKYSVDKENWIDLPKVDYGSASVSNVLKKIILLPNVISARYIRLTLISTREQNVSLGEVKISTPKN